MQIQSTALRTTQARPKTELPQQSSNVAPEATDGDSFSFSPKKSSGSILKPLATMVGAGAGLYAAASLVSFSPGVGGVANAIVGGVGLGATGLMGASSLTSEGSAEDKMAGALLGLFAGGVGFVAGTVMGGKGYNTAMLAAGAGAVIGGALGNAFAGSLQS